MPQTMYVCVDVQTILPTFSTDADINPLFGDDGYHESLACDCRRPNVHPSSLPTITDLLGDLGWHVSHPLPLVTMPE